MSEFVKPIYAKGIFSMDSEGFVTQYLIFYYTDPKMYYANLTREEYEEELNKVKLNMQSFLDEEEIRINDRRVRARVLYANIGLITLNTPYIEFLIRFGGGLRKGVNVYEDIYEEEVTEYPYDILWYLPGKVLEVSMAGSVKIMGNIVLVRVGKGLRVGGREVIRFVV